RHAAGRDRRRRSGGLPRGRVDRVELPDHARSRRRASGRLSRRGPRAAGAAGPRDGRELGHPRSRAGADRARGPRRRGDRRQAASCDRGAGTRPAATIRCARERHPSAGDGARMKTVRTVAELRATLAPRRRAERTIGLVPTMGALHEGHLSLMRHARRQCDVVVVSLFVNPAQFNDAADLIAYPRDPTRDAALAAEIGVDHLFAPSVEEVYPPGFATTVSVAGITDRLEGQHRGRAHFDGVTTIVTKLFIMVGPDVAYFGQKDAQQALVIRRLVRDLDIPVRIEVCPTIREPDGLALSSRNALLSPADRARATAL